MTTQLSFAVSEHIDDETNKSIRLLLLLSAGFIRSQRVRLAIDPK